jgi:hypothetical protein
MAIAMTVGATKVQVLQEKALSALVEKQPAETGAEPDQEGTEKESPAAQGSCST